MLYTQTIININIDKKLKDKVIELTKEIGQYYPNYDKWLDKVFEEQKQKTGTRKIIVLRETDNKDIIGLAIIKVKEDSRIKLCSFIINKNYRRKGYGDILMKYVKSIFSKNPIFTMNEKVFYDFRSLLIKYNFKYSKIEKGVYNKEDTEIYFNL